MAERPEFTYLHADGTDCDHERMTWEQSDDENMVGCAQVTFTRHISCSGGLAITGAREAIAHGGHG